MSLLRFTQPLVALRELGEGVPLAVTVGEEQLVVVRQGTRLDAYPPRCPHRGTALVHAAGSATRGELVCPYHGWRIAADGQVRDARGRPVPGCRFEPYALEAHLGYAWLMRGAPLPVEAPAGFRFCGSEGFTLSAPFHVVLDNFNEGSHTPFIHGLTGPTPDQLDAVAFDWSDQPDHVAIRYRGPQRKNLVFYGLAGLLPGEPRVRLTWEIAWRTYFAPVHMVYESSWYPEDRPAAPRFRTRHYYFIAPAGSDRTRFHAFTFARFDSYPALLHPLLGGLAMRLTRNQVLEDERFYPRIRDLPEAFHGLHLERFDQPIVRIRGRAVKEYLGDVS